MRHSKKAFCMLAICLFSCIAYSQERLTGGMVIRKSLRIKQTVYRLNASTDTSKPLIIIEGDNIVVDFNKSTISGSNDVTRPDQYYGVCILIRNSSNVTIKNLNARRFKIGIIARNVNLLRLENCDLSYNYRQHLNSTQEREDISDWMSYHHNEKDEWLRYGAAIYLRGCNSAIITNCHVTGGQNALMMMECNNGRIFNNDFSFNSGIGLGMYRCSHNEVGYNRINFNVRGYSDGVYNRGQDSAGILVYEQSNSNVFFKNSVTHSGDGFFLWAGQTTMDTGEGGCNDNLISGNDFSYAPTNGIELTFSRNTIIGNKVFDCDNGIWGGYSFETLIQDNQFRNNRIGIAIEHGQHNKIVNNLFIGNREAIRLWSNTQQDPNWGYPKHHDTRSVDYQVIKNSFNNDLAVLNVKRTDSINVFGNTSSGFITRYNFDSTVRHVDSFAVDLASPSYSTPVVNRPMDPFIGNGKFIGRKNILITEWGPYDFRYPIIWNTNPTDTSLLMKFDIIGPPGHWKIMNYKGIDSFSSREGSFPATLSAKRSYGQESDISIELEYRGGPFTTAMGESVPKGKPYVFRFRKYFKPIAWDVLFYPLDTASYNPLHNDFLFAPTARMAPFASEKVTKLDYAWWGGIKAGAVQHTQFITVATATANFPPGEYELSVTWDDAVRVYIDEKMVVNEWNPSLYDFDESPHRTIKIRLGGEQHLRVEHLELGGFATLSLKIRPVE
jgi:parallel beta-helix repeat protein